AEVESPDVLVAARLPATARIGIAPPLVLVAIDRVRLDAGADMGDDLFGQAAVGRGEGLPLALRGIARFGEGDALDGGGGLVRGQEVGDLGLERDLEWVNLQRGLVATVRRRPVVELGRMAEGGGARPGDPDGLGRDAIRLGGTEHVRGGEPPGAVDEDADPKPLALARGDALHPAGLDGDALVATADDADIGV